LTAYAWQYRDSLKHAFERLRQPHGKGHAYEGIEGKRKRWRKNRNVVAREAVEAGDERGMCEVEQRYGNYVKASKTFSKKCYRSWLSNCLNITDINEYLKKMVTIRGDRYRDAIELIVHDIF
jgi:hypothetical protein